MVIYRTSKGYSEAHSPERQPTMISRPDATCIGLKDPISRSQIAMLLMAPIGNVSGIAGMWITYQGPELTLESSLESLPMELHYMLATRTSSKAKCPMFEDAIGKIAMIDKLNKLSPNYNPLLKVGSPLAVIAAARWNLLCTTCIPSGLSLDMLLGA